MMPSISSFLILATLSCILALCFIMLPFIRRANFRSILVGSTITVASLSASIFLYFQYGDIKGVKDKAFLESVAGTLARVQQGDELSQASVIQALQDIQKNIPNSDVSWHYLGSVYHHLNFLNEAANAYQQAAILNTANSRHVLQQAFVLSKLNSGKLPSSAKLNCQQILADEPSNQQALNLLAIDAYQNQEYQLAINYWQSLLANTQSMSQKERHAITLMLTSAKNSLVNPPVS